MPSPDVPPGTAAARRRQHAGCRGDTKTGSDRLGLHAQSCQSSLQSRLLARPRLQLGGEALRRTVRLRDAAQLCGCQRKL